jgi:TPR repeat protein
MRPLALFVAISFILQAPVGAFAQTDPSQLTEPSPDRDSVFDPESQTAIKCYVVTRDDIRYGERPGIDPATGRECRPVTSEVVERLRAYKWGNRPKRIETTDPIFFSLRTGEPIVWYHKTENGTIDLFDLMGFDPETGDEMLPITREVVALWRSQEQKRKEAERQRQMEETRQIPQPIDPTRYEPFDPLSGKPRIWYSRDDEDNYRFYDNPGHDPRTGEPLAIITRDILDEWRKSLLRRAAQKCYIITQDTREPVQYRDHPGTDSVTGRQCRPITSEVVERIREYEKGNRPKRIETAEPQFFDLRTGEPVVWYYKDTNGKIQIFDLMGFHPDTGEELVPITKDVVALWKAQDTERKTEGARNPPQRIDPEQYAFFDPLTGKARVWYMRTASGEYQFYDNSGYHPETGEPLSIITKEVVDAWREFSSKPQAKRCYVITRDEHNPVRYGEQPGIDPVTGRQCRELTSEVVERLREYEKGNRPKRVEMAEPTFFDLRTGEPIIWYYKDKDGNIELFDLMGFHPSAGEELVPVNREIAELWKQQLTRRIPQRIQDPLVYGAFDPVTGRSRIWYLRTQNGDYEFYDSPGFHPTTGEPLILATRETIDAWKGSLEEHAPIRSPKKIELGTETVFFDPKTGAHLLWYWHGKVSEYEFFDGPGFHPRNGESLKPATREVLDTYQRELQEKQAEVKKEEERLRREQQARRDEAERKKAEQQKKDADEEKRRDEQLRRLTDSARRCDEFAANPSDIHRVGQGLPYGELKPKASEAVAACELAAQQSPDELRFTYQLGRALELKGEGSELANNRQRALKIHEQLVAKGYPAAFDNLGSMYLDRNDLPRAVGLFRRGIRAGDSDSMVSFAELVERGWVNPANSSESPLELYHRAAELGNQNGGRAYEQELARRGNIQRQQLQGLEQQKMMMQFLGTVLQNIRR